MRTAAIFFVALTMAAVPCSVSAESLKVKEAKFKQEKDLPRFVNDLNKKCEAEVAVELDFANFTDKDEGKSLVGYCDNALSGIERVCAKSPAGKVAVKEKIKKVVCKVGDTRAVTVDNGTLTYTVQWTAGNDADFVQEYLRSNL